MHLLYNYYKQRRKGAETTFRNNQDLQNFLEGDEQT